jgi:hypothetical protein
VNAFFADIMNMRKLLPRSSSSKSQGDEEEGEEKEDKEEASALDLEPQRSDGSGEPGGEGTAEKGGDTQPEEPVPSTTKSDNQTIMRFLGEREKVRITSV